MKFRVAVLVGIVANKSPSPRRAWIEINLKGKQANEKSKSPSPRRAWIEMILFMILFMSLTVVALPTEGVD